MRNARGDPTTILLDDFSFASGALHVVIRQAGQAVHGKR
jgi:hypothetical protein